MKKYIVIAFVFIGTIVSAQNKNQPKLETKGILTFATYFYDNGSVQQEGTFNKDGVLEGLWTNYDFEGNKLSQGNYSNGIKTGKWFFWTEDSLKEVDYVDSRITAVNEWNSKSELATTLN